MFVNILIANGKNSILNGDNLRQPIKMQLAQKDKTFSEFVSVFLKLRLNLEHFQKDDPHSWWTSEINYSEKRC